MVMDMDDFAQLLSGQIVDVQPPFDGKALQAGKKFARVESGKWLGTAYSPVDDTLDSSNRELEADPSLISQDCYRKGWMFMIRCMLWRTNYGWRHWNPSRLLKIFIMIRSYPS
jgi:glycine cleavage system H protein